MKWNNSLFTYLIKCTHLIVSNREFLCMYVDWEERKRFLNTDSIYCYVYWDYFSSWLTFGHKYFSRPFPSCKLLNGWHKCTWHPGDPLMSLPPCCPSWCVSASEWHARGLENHGGWELVTQGWEPGIPSKSVMEACRGDC